MQKRRKPFIVRDLNEMDEQVPLEESQKGRLEFDDPVFDVKCHPNGEFLAISSITGQLHW